MKPIPTADNVPPQLISISYKLEQQKFVYSDDAYWVAGAAVVIRNMGHNLQQVVELLNRAISERNEAQRMYCRAMSDAVKPYRSPEDIAADREWHCFGSVTVSGEVADAK